MQKYRIFNESVESLDLCLDFRVNEKMRSQFFIRLPALI